MKFFEKILKIKILKYDAKFLNLKLMKKMHDEYPCWRPMYILHPGDIRKNYLIDNFKFRISINLKCGFIKDYLNNYLYFQKEVYIFWFA
jgi:hypothetical protein